MTDAKPRSRKPRAPKDPSAPPAAKRARVKRAAAVKEAPSASAAAELWPEGAHASVRERHAEQHREEAARVIAELAGEGIAALVLPGMALACTRDVGPTFRAGSESDVLIPVESRLAAEAALVRLGYGQERVAQRDYVAGKSLWKRDAGPRAAHHFGLHWRIGEHHVLANALPYAELAVRAQPLPALGPEARALAPLDALLVACVHVATCAPEPEAANGEAAPGGDRLARLRDVHLLAAGLSEAEFHLFAEIAVGKRVRALCLEALERSSRALGTVVPTLPLVTLSQRGLQEPSSLLLSESRSRRLLGDLLGMPTWRSQWRWLRQAALPEPDYMRWRFPDRPEASLRTLYLRRAWMGALRLLRPASSRK